MCTIGLSSPTFSKYVTQDNRSRNTRTHDLGLSTHSSIKKKSPTESPPINGIVLCKQFTKLDLPFKVSYQLGMAQYDLICNRLK